MHWQTDSVKTIIKIFLDKIIKPKIREIPLYLVSYTNFEWSEVEWSHDAILEHLVIGNSNTLGHTKFSQFQLGTFQSTQDGNTMCL